MSPENGTGASLKDSAWNTEVLSEFVGEKNKIQAAEPCSENLGLCVWMVCAHACMCVFACVCVSVKVGLQRKGRRRGAVAEQIVQKQIVEGFECWVI